MINIKEQWVFCVPQTTVSDYIHRNPLHEKWNLAKRPEEYKWSSAKYYEDGEDVFGILTHYADRF